MHKFFQIIIMALALVVGIVLPCMVDAQNMPPGRWWRVPKIAEKLDITAEEKNRFDKMFSANRRNLIDAKFLLEKEQFELENLMDEEPLDEKAVMDQFKRLEQARGALAAERFHFLLKIRQILGYNRFQQLKTMFREFKEKRQRGKRFPRKNRRS